MEQKFDGRVPHITLVLDQNYINEGAKKVLEVIRPHWNPQSITFKLLTDGITNKLVACKSTLKDLEVACPEDIVLVRVYGNKTDLLIDRKAETRNILLLSKIDLAPSLYATFENGLAYQFVPGSTLADATVRDPKIYPLVANRLAKLHKVQTQERDVRPFIWLKIQSFLELVPDVFHDQNKQERFLEMGISKANIQSEIERIKKVLCNLGSAIVFCHNDLLLGNVIYDEEKECVTFIDYEYAAFNYQAFDIANHFLEFAGVDNVDYSRYPNKDFQLHWIRLYLNEYCSQQFSEDDVVQMQHQVENFTLLSHLFWGIWALIQTEHSYIDFDFLKYAGIRFKEYFSTLEKLGLSQ